MYYILFGAHILRAWISREMELPEVGVPLGQLRQTPGQFPDEVEREVEPLEGLARLQVFDPLDRVHAQVEVLQTAQPRQVLDALDAVVLFELGAKYGIREAGMVLKYA